MNDAELFFFVDSKESKKEIFRNTRAAAKRYEELRQAGDHDVAIGKVMVRNYFKETNGEWNYDDRADTFSNEIIINIDGNTGKTSKNHYCPYHTTLKELKCDYLKRPATYTLEEIKYFIELLCDSGGQNAEMIAEYHEDYFNHDYNEDRANCLLKKIKEVLLKNTASLL